MGRSVRKIVFVVPRFDCGGAERVSVTFAKQLMRAGNQVEFVNGWRYMIFRLFV